MFDAVVFASVFLSKQHDLVKWPSRVQPGGGGQGAQVLMANEAAGALHQLTELRRSFRNLGSPWQ